MSDEVPRFVGMYETGADFEGLDVELVVPCRILALHGAQSGREIEGALIRSPGEEPAWVQGWRSDAFVGDAPQVWKYFKDGSWDNGQSTEVRWLRIARAEDAAAVLVHLAAGLGAPPEHTAPSQPTDGSSEAITVTNVEQVGAEPPAGDEVGSRPLRIERVEPPNWLSAYDPAINYSSWEELTAEQAQWGSAIPQMYRVLNSPAVGHELLRAPRQGDDIAVAATYWCALLHLLTYSMGWVRPERGLLAWQYIGEPVDDLRLQLLWEVWRADGMLDWFHAWTYAQPLKHVTDQLTELTGFVDDDEDSPSNPGWIEDQKAVAAHSRIPAPCGMGGSDPLHLSMHLSGPIREPTGTVSMVHTSGSRRRAVLILDSMVGWYRALCSEGAKLPKTGDPSWRVEVVVRTIGSLGVFRRSRDTGIWFSGAHRYHTLGIGKHTWANPPPIWHS